MPNNFQQTSGFPVPYKQSYNREFCFPRPLLKFSLRAFAIFSIGVSCGFPNRRVSLTVTVTTHNNVDRC